MRSADRRINMIFVKKFYFIPLILVIAQVGCSFLYSIHEASWVLFLSMFCLFLMLLYFIFLFWVIQRLINLVQKKIAVDFALITFLLLFICQIVYSTLELGGVEDQDNVQTFEIFLTGLLILSFLYLVFESSKSILKLESFKKSNSNSLLKTMSQFLNLMFCDRGIIYRLEWIEASFLED